MTHEQEERIIKEHVEKLRRELNIEVYPKPVARMYYECNRANDAFSYLNEFDFEMIDTQELNNPDLGAIDEDFIHRASLIKVGETWYIVDPCYGQYFEKEEVKDYMFKNHEVFSRTLLRDGYIKYSKEGIEAFLDPFIKFGNLHMQYDYLNSLLIPHGLAEESWELHKPNLIA